MVVGKSPEWLPSGFTEKVRSKSGRKIKYYYNVATGEKFHSKKDVLSYATAENDLLGAPQKSNGDDNGLSSNSVVDAGLDKMGDSQKWLPVGWTVEEKMRQRGSRRGLMYKVYTEVSSGNRFYSRAAVTRYLKTVDHANTMTVETKVDEPLPHMSPQCPSMTNTGGTPEEKKLDKVDEPSPNCLSMTNTCGTLEENKSTAFKTPDKVYEPSPHMSPQCLSMTNTGNVTTENKKCYSFMPVAIESSAAEDLPPGWIKEIITSKSGSKIRKDPYYTDPVSGYVFRSKLDALRYLKTNDIRSCVMRPKKLGELNLVKNEIPSSTPAHEKLPEQKRELFVGGESNDFGESSGGIKTLAQSVAKVTKATVSNSDIDSVKSTSAGPDCLEGKSSFQNPLKNTETQINPVPGNEVSKDEPKVIIDVNAAISPPATNPSTKRQPYEHGMGKQTEMKTQVNSKNPRKRKAPSLPSRTSKRLARNEPEMPSNSVLSENYLGAAEKRSSGSEVNNASSASVPLLSDIELTTKEASNHAAFVSDETPKEIGPPKEFEKLPVENPVIPEEQTDGNAGEDKQESQLCFDFGDSWSDPLEFALKTLRGEIPIDDPLAFPGCFNENLGIPYNGNQLDGCLRPSQSDVPDIFKNEVAPNSGYSKQQSAVDPLPASSSSFSALGDIGFPGFSGFNNQSSTDAGRKGSQTKFNP